MAGLVPAFFFFFFFFFFFIHVSSGLAKIKDVDARHKAGHDGGEAVRFTALAVKRGA